MPGLRGPGGKPLAAGLQSILLAGTAVAGGTAPGTSGGSYGGSSSVTANAITAPNGGPFTVSGGQVLAANGKAVRLGGSHQWSNGVDIITTAGVGAYSTGANNQAFDNAAYLTFLANEKAGGYRLWAWESPTDGGGTYGAVSPVPYVKSGTQYDLSQVSSAYTARVLSRVQAAEAAGIVPFVMLFDGASVLGAPGSASNMNFTTGNPWSHHPYNSANNVNSLNGDPNGHGDGLDSHRQTSGAIWNYQIGYVTAMMQALKNEPSFIWEICNESATDSQSLAWQTALINFIHSWEAANGGVRHLVCFSSPADANSNAGALNSYMQSSPADLYTPSGAGGIYQTGNIPTAPGGKPCVLDTDHIYGMGGDQAWVWQGFMAGYPGGLYMDDLHGTGIAGCLIPGGVGLDSTEASARIGLAQTGYIASLVDTTGMVPSSIASGYSCLANPSTGMAIVYAPGGGDPVLDLSSYGSQLGYRWYDLSGSGELTSIASIAQNASAVSLPCPTGAGVLIIRPATVSVTQASSGSLSALVTAGTVGQAITGTSQLQNATTAYVRLRVGGQDQGSPVQLSDASGNFSLTPTAADTAAVVLTLDQAGTEVLWTSAAITVSAPVAETGSFGNLPTAAQATVPISGITYTDTGVSTPYYTAQATGYAESARYALSGGTVPTFTVNSNGVGPLALRMYDAASGGNLVATATFSVAAAPVQQPETITLNNPGSQTAGDSFAISGSIANKIGSPALQLLNGTTALSVTLTLSGTTFTGTLPGQNADLSLSVKDTANNVTSNIVDVTVAAQQQGGGTTENAVAGGYYFGGAVVGAVGSRTGSLTNMPSGTVQAGQPLSPAGNFSVSGVPAFGNTAYVGLYNKTGGFYEYFHTGYNLLYPLQALTTTSGQLMFPNPSTGALEALKPSLYNGGGPYTIRLCSDVAGLYVLAESPVFQVAIPAYAGATSSGYQNSVAGAPGNGTTVTVGPGKQFATVSNAIEAIINDLKVNGPGSTTYYDAVLLVDPVPGNDGYYLNDCNTGSCPNATPFAYGDTHYTFKDGSMPNVPLTIRGNLAVNGQRPHFTWGGNVNSKGYWRRGSGFDPDNQTGNIKQGFPLTLENLHFSGDGGPTTPAGQTQPYESYNFPCIGMQDALEGDLNINNCFIDYWPEVVVGGNEGAGLYIRNSTIQYCGGPGGGADVHTIYVGELSEVIMSDTKLQLPGYEANGHHVKSRAFRTHLIRCAVQDGETGVGTSFVVDFPQGGDVLIQDSLLYHGPGATNVIMLNHGEETRQTGAPGQPVTSTGNNGFPYFHPGRIRIVNSALLNGVPSNSPFGDFPGVANTNLETDQYELAPWIEMDGCAVFGMDASNTYFRNFTGAAPRPYQPPDPAMVALGSLPTLDYSSPPATGQLNALANVSFSGPKVSTAATGGTVSAPSGAQQLTFSSFNVTLSGGNVAFLSLSVGGAEEWGRTPVFNGQTFTRLPISSGTYTAQLYNALTGGSAIGSPVTFNVAAAAPNPIPAPTGLTVLAVYGQSLLIKSSVVSGTGSVYYQLGYRTSGGAWQLAFGIPDTNGTTVSYLLSAMTPGTTYEIAVAAMDDYGSGQQSGSINAVTASAGQNVQNHGPYTFSAITFDSSPAGKPGDNNAGYRSDLGKVSGTVSNGSGNGPPELFLTWSTSNLDPSINPFNEGSQPLTYYSASGYYNNDVLAGPTGQTCYPWIITSDGYCFTDGSSYTFS